MQMLEMQTPFSMVFGDEAVIPDEIQEEALRVTHFDPIEIEELKRTDSAFVEEMRNNAKARYNMYKKRL